MKLSIVIPAYNEKKRIIDSLKTIDSYMKKNNHIVEIIIIDDGSTDGMSKEIKNTKINNIKILKNKKNMGKGYSTKKGLLNSKYPFTLITDSDLATPINEFEKLAKYTNEYSVIIGSRNMIGSKIVITQPLYRQILGKVFPLIVNFLLIKNIKDTQCGFKLLKTDIAKKIAKKQTIRGFAFDVEVLFIAQKNKIKIKEVPITWFNKKGSKVDPIKDSLKMLVDLIKIKTRSLYGKYKI